MRAGLSTIQQTLTPEAASVLKRSIAEAARRNHGQTTPLHVAATLLAAPSCLLRQACARSHPQSSHPLQCRALELCFSVALDRLPASNLGPSSVEPPISNALMAALKRAQANQRRGCPEQQQQPLLAVKVELEQLVISILDDPSVSRVMREASFSSVAVKAAVEHSISTSSPSSVSPAAAASAPSVGSLATATSPPAASGFLGLSNRAPRCHNLYINSRLHQHQGSDGAASTTIIASVVDQPREEEVNRVLDILSRPKKRNPILVGDCNPDAVMREVMQRIQCSNAPPKLHNAQVLPFAKEIAAAAQNPSQIAIKIGELSCSIESLGGERAVILDLGDLKWLVESHSVSTASGPTHPPKAIVSEAGRAAVEEMGKLLKKFQYGDRLWVVGTAACATYLRCQVYHPTMESDWDLQAVPFAPRSSLTSTLQRFGGCNILSSSVEKLAPTKGFVGMCDPAMPLRRPQESINPLQRKTLCPSCFENYERELANLITGESKKNSTKPETSQGLPQWLKIAKLSSGGSTNSASAPVKPKEEELYWNQSTDELLKRWTETCSSLHSNFHLSHIRFEMPLLQSLSKPIVMGQQNLSSTRKLSISTSLSLNQLESNQVTVAPEKPTSPSRSHVRTDLVLSNSEVSNSSLDMTYNDQHMPNIAGISDIDLFKRLSKGLMEKVSWQQEAASAIASAVMQCKSGTGKRRTVRTKGDTWLLLFGPDKVGKKKMATALSELMFGTGPTIVKLGRASCADCNDGESYFSYRGRTIMDRVVEAVRQNPLSVILLEDIDQADILLKGKIKQGIERGRLPDSHGREVSLGSVIFVLTADWLPAELRSSYSSILQDEEKMLDLAYSGVELELSTENKPAKRSPDWVCDNNQPVKLRKECSLSTGLSLDLNLAVGIDVDVGEGSGNSSDLTTDHECDKGRLAMKYSTASLASELVDLVDEAIMLKPVDFGLLRRNVMQSALVRFASLMGEGREIRIDDNAIDRIIAGLWFSRAAFDEWAEKVLVPSLKQLRKNLRSDSEVVVVRLSTIKGDQRVQINIKDCLPTKVAVAINGGNDNS